MSFRLMIMNRTFLGASKTFLGSKDPGFDYLYRSENGFRDREIEL